MEVKKNLFTVAEAADILSLHYRTVLKLINNGFIHCIHIGRKLLVSEAELTRFINSADKESVIYYIK